MTPEEVSVVERAVRAVRAVEDHQRDPDSTPPYTGPTADGIVSEHLEGRGLPRDGERWRELIREVIRRAWVDPGRDRPMVGDRSPTARDRALGYYDRFRPSGRRLDQLDQDAA